MPPLPTVSDMKTRLGLTTSGDDSLLTVLLSDSIYQAERDTGRTIAAASNTSTTYSTNQEFSLVIDDRPFVDASRVVRLNGVTMVEGTNVWFLPDRRDQNITATIQLRPYSGRYVRDFNWFDGNHDSPRYMAYGTPNDLVITGISGMPFPDQDIVNGIATLCTFLYWKAKSGGSGQVSGPTGADVSLAELDEQYARFVMRWRIHTAVSAP